MITKKEVPRYAMWRMIAVAMFIITLIINGFSAATTVLGGTTTAEVSNSYANLFTPSGFTFSIWSAIYILLGIYLVSTFGIVREKKSPLSSAHKLTLIKLFTVTCVLNTLWMLSWQYRIIWLSLLLMFALLITLKIAHALLASITHTVRSFVTARLPFSIYLGWITVATVANVTVWLVSINWDGFGLRPGIWMVFVVLAAAAIGIFHALRSHDWAYLAVFVWAYAGILYRHLSGSAFNGQYPTTIGALQISLAVLIVLVIFLVTTYPIGHTKPRNLFARLLGMQ